MVKDSSSSVVPHAVLLELPMKSASSNKVHVTSTMIQEELELLQKSELSIMTVGTTMISTVPGDLPMKGATSSRRIQVTSTMIPELELPMNNHPVVNSRGVQVTSTMIPESGLPMN
jgi:hypothetical protein